MFHICRSVLLLAILSGCCAAALAAQTFSWRLVYSSDFRGELKPCGCSQEGDLGGVLRRVTKFTQLRQQAKETIFVSAGDILGPPDEQGVIKGRYMLQAHRYFALDAILPGEQDLLHPLASLQKADLPWVLTNNDGNLPFADHRERHLPAGKRLLVFALLDPQLTDASHKKHLRPPETALQNALRRTKAKAADLIILLLHGNENFAGKFAQQPLLDIIVRGHLHKPVSPAALSSGIPILSAGYRGRRIGIAEVQTNASTRVTDNSIIPLPRTIADDPRLSRLYARYDREIARWYQAKTARTRQTQTASTPYGTVSLCRLCHEDIYKKWQDSRHAGAMRSLRRAGKHLDPECLRCHTTGMGEAGGFVSLSVTAALADVQCEACHGAARSHAEYPLVNKTGNSARSCRNCHTPEHSPAFQPVSYRSKIAHRITTPPPIHQQSISPISGVYTVLRPDQPVISRETVEVSEYFSFYCSRCYILDKNWPSLITTLARPIRHRQIPVVFTGRQQPWASLAFLAAEQAGKGREFKTAVFAAKFERNADIGDRQVIVDIATTLGLGERIHAVLNRQDETIEEKFRRYREMKERNHIRTTPTLIINDNLRVLAKDTANNTNLLMENLSTILLDIQCRQYAVCDNNGFP